MSLEEILSEVRSMNEKFEALREEVDVLKENKDRERSRSPRRKTPPARRESPPPRRESKAAEATKKSWADTDPSERADYSLAVHFSDEDDPVESDLVEVSEETRALLTTSCTRSVPNETRRRTRSRYKLPKVAATRTPRLDHFMKSETSLGAKSLDKDLARIQTFVLDALAPLTSILDNNNLTEEAAKHASSTAVELIGNANAQISRLRREKIVQSVNKSLLPLVKEDTSFKEASPYLFGDDFAKRQKDFSDQIKALRAGRHSHTEQTFRKPLFRKGLPPGRGMARGRGGGPSNYRYRGGRTDRQPRQDQKQ